MTNLEDPTQYETTYTRLFPLAFSAANRVLRDAATAEDVAQDVFLQLWRRPRSFDPNRGSLSSYVAMMARSRATDRWRARSTREAAVQRSAQELRLRPSAEDAAEPVIRRDSQQRVLRAIRYVPTYQREAVLLAYGRGLTAQEIARAAHVPLGTAKSRVRLGLEKARANLQADA